MSDRDILKSALAATPNCLSPEQLEALVEGKASKEHPHVSQCPRCQAELALLRAFESETPLPGEGAAVAWISSDLDRRLAQIKNPGKAASAGAAASSTSWWARTFGTPWLRYGVLAAACAAIVAVAVVGMRSSKEPELRASVSEQSPIYRSTEVQTISPEGDISETPKSLAWQAFAGAATYRVSLMEVDRTELWSAQTSAPEVTIPAEIRAKIVPNKPILWQVTALSSTGNTLAVSSMRRFLFRQQAGSKDSSIPRN